MAGDLPPAPGGGPTTPPPTPGQWAPTHPTQPKTGSPTWPALAVAALAVVVAVAAMIVAITRPRAMGPSATTTAPTFTAAETAAAQRQLCDTYKLVARAVQVDTNGNNPALARVATTNGAVMLDNAAADPALDAAHRDAARALATAYLTTTAMGNKDVASDPDFHAALDDLIAKDAVMKKICAGG
jgi:hypothetical protein